MTKDEFIERYTRMSRIAVAELHILGLHAEPCDCKEEDCQGWQMVSKEEL